MAILNRGFRRKRDVEAPADRVPPGQYVTRDFPVLSAGPTPRIGHDEWQLTSSIGVGTSRPGTGLSSWTCRPNM